MTPISTDIKNTLAHYQGVHHELTTGEKHSCQQCAPVHLICHDCKTELKTTFGAAKGWVEIEGDDYCPTCSPYSERRAA